MGFHNYNRFGTVIDFIYVFRILFMSKHLLVRTNTKESVAIELTFGNDSSKKTNQEEELHVAPDWSD